MNSELITALASAFFIGLLGAGHCFAMCGGIMAAVSLPSSKKNKKNENSGSAMLLSLFYQLGRIKSYAVIGVLAGLLGFQLNLWLSGISPLPILRIFAGLMLVLLGLYLSGWWRVLTKLEYFGQRLWKHIEPIGRRFLPIDSYLKAFVVGMVWGWLPCGLVYSTLALALAQSEPIAAGLVMASFGVGTLPAMWLGGVFGASVATLIRATWFRVATSSLMILFGVWTIYIAAVHAGHRGHDDSYHKNSTEAPIEQRKEHYHH